MTKTLPAPAKAQIETAKTPIVRLLDMTAGWSAFAQQNENGTIDPAVSEDALCRLYQDAGELWNALEESGADEQAEAEAVRDFVTERVLPLLLEMRPAASE